MKWITRERVKVDRVACPWLIKKFVDKDAEFIFVPADKVVDEAKRLNAILYDVKNVELEHHGKECSFEAILKKYKLSDDPALVLLGKIVNGADTDNTLYPRFTPTAGRWCGRASTTAISPSPLHRSANAMTRPGRGSLPIKAAEATQPT